MASCDEGFLLFWGFSSLADEIAEEPNKSSGMSGGFGLTCGLCVELFFSVEA